MIRSDPVRTLSTRDIPDLIQAGILSEGEQIDPISDRTSGFGQDMVQMHHMTYLTSLGDKHNICVSHHRHVVRPTCVPPWCTSRTLHHVHMITRSVTC